MRKFRSVLYPAVATLFTFAGSATLAQAQTDTTAKADSTTRTTISQEQAVRGMTVFTKTCVECHTKTDVSGADFKLKWHTRPVFDLFDVIRTTMPDDRPGALTQEEYIDVTAYILRINGAQAAGMPLAPTDTASLKKLRMEILVPSPNLDSVTVDTTKAKTDTTKTRSMSGAASINRLFTSQRKAR